MGSLKIQNLEFLENKTIFLRNKKILKLCLRWHILRNCCFVGEVTFNPIQDGERRQKGPHRLPVFPLKLLQTYELAPKTFWLLVVTFLPHWCKPSSFYLAPVPNYWTWTKTTSKKNGFPDQILKKLRLW